MQHQLHHQPATPTSSLLTLLFVHALALSDSWEDAYKENPETLAQFNDPSTKETIPHMKNRFKYNRFWTDDNASMPRSKVTDVI